MALPHQPFSSQVPHAPFINLGGGGGGGVTLAELLEILAGTKEPKSIRKAALSEEVNELLGKGGPPSGAAGGVLAGTYPEPSLKAEGVTTAAIKLLAIVESLLGEESVSAIKLKAKAVTSTKIALEAILAEHLGKESVTTAAIKLLAITTALIAEAAVTESKLSAAVVTKLNEKGGSPKIEKIESLGVIATGSKLKPINGTKLVYCQLVVQLTAAKTAAVVITVKVNKAGGEQKEVVKLEVTGPGTTQYAPYISFWVPPEGEYEVTFAATEGAIKVTWPRLSETVFE